MEANSLYKKTKILLAEKIQSFMFGELGEVPLQNSQLPEPNWGEKLSAKKTLGEIFDYSTKVTNYILDIRGKPRLEEEQIYLSEREKKVLIEFLQEDSIELIKQLEELSKDKDALGKNLTALKNILGDNLTDWETKLAKKTDLDQANNSLTQLANEKSQLQQQITNFINQLNDLNNGNKNKEELEQKIKQLTNELEQAQNKEPPRTNEPSDYQDIKTELEQLRKQVVNSQDKELMKKVAELTDKINQRERESKNTASQVNLPSEQRLYWIIGGMGLVIIILLVFIIRGMFRKRKKSVSQ